MGGAFNLFFKMTKKIAIICFTDYTREPRVLRTIETLKDMFEIDIYSTGAGNYELDISKYNYDRVASARGSFLSNKIRAVIAMITKSRFPSPNFFKKQYWSKGRKELFYLLDQKKYKLVIGHGIYTVPILAELNSAKTVFNAHEYYPGEFEENELWKKYTQPFYNFILTEYLYKVDLMFCVSQNIANEYIKNYNIRSVEFTNATDLKNLVPSEVDQKNIKIVHHGAAIRTRKIEVMIETVLLLGAHYSLHLLLVDTDVNYLEELKAKYSHHTNIFFHRPVAVSEIGEEINKYDIGIFILPPVNFNWINALPNKLFEYIQGRLAIAVSPNPDMKRVVERYDLGIVAADYSAESMAQKIAELTIIDIERYKLNAHKNAKELSAETNKKMIIQNINELVLN